MGKVDYPSRCSDDEVQFCVEGTALALVVHSAKDQNVVEAGESAQKFRVLVDLDGQFPGGSEDQCSWHTVFALAFQRTGQQAVENGEQKRRRLSGSGLCFPREVPAFQKQGDGHGLNGGAVFKSGLLGAEQDLFCQTEILKAGLPFAGRDLFQLGGHGALGMAGDQLFRFLKFSGVMLFPGGAGRPRLPGRGGLPAAGTFFACRFGVASAPVFGTCPLRFDLDAAGSGLLFAGGCFFLPLRIFLGGG